MSQTRTARRSNRSTAIATVDDDGTAAATAVMATGTAVVAPPARRSEHIASPRPVDSSSLGPTFSSPVRALTSKESVFASKSPVVHESLVASATPAFRTPFPVTTHLGAGAEASAQQYTVIDLSESDSPVTVTPSSSMTSTPRDTPFGAVSLSSGVVVLSDKAEELVSLGTKRAQPVSSYQVASRAGRQKKVVAASMSSSSSSTAAAPDRLEHGTDDAGIHSPVGSTARTRQIEVWTKTAARLDPAALRFIFRAAFTPVKMPHALAHKDLQFHTKGRMYIPRFSNDAGNVYSQCSQSLNLNLTEGGIAKIRSCRLGIDSLLSLQVAHRADSLSELPSFPIRVQVLSVHRYTSIPQQVLSSVMNPDTRRSGNPGQGQSHNPLINHQLEQFADVHVEPSSVYDIVLSDGKFKTKVVLESALAPLVEVGLIRTGAIVQVHKVVRRDVSHLRSLVKYLARTDTSVAHAEHKEREEDTDDELASPLSGVDLGEEKGERRIRASDEVSYIDGNYSIVVVKELSIENPNVPIIINRETCQNSLLALREVLRGTLPVWASELMQAEALNFVSCGQASGSALKEYVVFPATDGASESSSSPLESMVHWTKVSPIVFPCATPGEAALAGQDHNLSLSWLIPFLSLPGAIEQRGVPLISTSRTYLNLYTNDGAEPLQSHCPVLCSTLIERALQRLQQRQSVVSQAVSIGSSSGSTFRPQDMNGMIALLRKALFLPDDRQQAPGETYRVQLNAKWIEDHPDISLADSANMDAALQRELDSIALPPSNVLDSVTDKDKIALSFLSPLLLAVDSILQLCKQPIDLKQQPRFIAPFASIIELATELGQASALASEVGGSLLFQSVPPMVPRSGSLLNGGNGTGGIWSATLATISALASSESDVGSVLHDLKPPNLNRGHNANYLRRALQSLTHTLRTLRIHRRNVVKLIAEQARHSLSRTEPELAVDSSSSQSQPRLDPSLANLLAVITRRHQELRSLWSFLLDKNMSASSTPETGWLISTNKSSMDSLEAARKVDFYSLFPNQSALMPTRLLLEELAYTPIGPLVSIAEIRRTASTLENDKDSVGARASVKGDLIGRVLAKSRLIQFARQGRQHREPLMCELVVADNTGLLRVSLWNSHVLRHWNRLRVGDIVALRGLRLKFTMQETKEGEPVFDVEASLNPTNPVGKLFLLHDDQLPGADAYRVFLANQQKEMGKMSGNSTSADGGSASVRPFESPAPSCTPLGKLMYPFVPISVAHTAPEGIPVDLAGMIAFAGRVEREPGPNKHQYLASRWLLLVDPSADDIFLPVRVYTNSRSDVVMTLKAGDVVFMTNIQIKSAVSAGFVIEYLSSRKQQATTVSRGRTSSDSTQDVVQGSGFDPISVVLSAWNRRQQLIPSRASSIEDSDMMIDPRWRRIRYGWDPVLTKLAQARAALGSEVSDLQTVTIDPSARFLLSQLAQPSLEDAGFKAVDLRQQIVEEALSRPVMKPWSSTQPAKSNADLGSASVPSSGTLENPRAFFGQSSHLTEVVVVDAWHHEVNKALSEHLDLREIVNWARSTFAHLSTIRISKTSAQPDSSSASPSSPIAVPASALPPAGTVAHDSATLLTLAGYAQDHPLGLLSSKLLLAPAIPSPLYCSVVPQALARRVSTLAGATFVSYDILTHVLPHTAANPISLAGCVEAMRSLAVMQASSVFLQGAVPFTLYPRESGLLPWNGFASGLLTPNLSISSDDLELESLWLHHVFTPSPRSELSEQKQGDAPSLDHSSAAQQSSDQVFPESVYDINSPLAYLTLIDRNADMCLRVALVPSSLARFSHEGLGPAAGRSPASEPSTAFSMSLLPLILRILDLDEAAGSGDWVAAHLSNSELVLSTDDRHVIRVFGLPRFFVHWAAVNSARIMQPHTLVNLLKLYAVALRLAAAVGSMYPRVVACFRKAKLVKPSARMKVLSMFLTYLRSKLLFGAPGDEEIAKMHQGLSQSGLQSANSSLRSTFAGAAAWARAVAGMMLASAISTFYTLLSAGPPAAVERSQSASGDLGRFSLSSHPFLPIGIVVNMYRKDPPAVSGVTLGVSGHPKHPTVARSAPLGSEGAVLQEVAPDTDLYCIAGPGDQALYQPPQLPAHLPITGHEADGVEVLLGGVFEMASTIDDTASLEALQWRIDVYSSLLAVLRAEVGELEAAETTIAELMATAAAEANDSGSKASRTSTRRQ